MKCPECGGIDRKRDLICHRTECVNNEHTTCRYKLVVISKHFDGCVNYECGHEEKVK